jgi:hypothetical protein
MEVAGKDLLVCKEGKRKLICEQENKGMDKTGVRI